MLRAFDCRQSALSIVVAVLLTMPLAMAPKAHAAEMACICDILCHPGEVYSDEQELCIPIEQSQDKQEQATS